MLNFLSKHFPFIVNTLLSSTPPTLLEKKGEQFAVKRFNITKNNIPAYKNFLLKKNFSRNVRNIKDFKKVPIQDKSNYIMQNKLTDLTGNPLYKTYTIERSSGYSGIPFYWPRTREEDIDLPLYLELASKQFFHIDRASTLAIITFGLGSWAGGEKISWVSREIAIRNKYPFTIITPGLKVDETLEIIKKFKDTYDQILLIGYPPFIKMVIDKGEKEGIKWPLINIKIGLGGEGFSEEWREYIRFKLNINENDLMAISSIYAAADLGINVGREYPITILIRKLAYKDKNLAENLFGLSNPLPTLCQFFPNKIFIEVNNSELIFTGNSGIPFVRYSIHDRGGVIPFGKMIKILNSLNYNPYDILINKYRYKKSEIWNLPFFYCFGRNQGTNVYGANIYPEYIKAALENSKLTSILSNNFKLDTNYDKNFNPIFNIHVELLPNIKPNVEIKYKLEKFILKTLLVLSDEYKNNYKSLKDLVKPNVILYNYKQKPFSDDFVKYHYQNHTAHES